MALSTDGIVAVSSGAKLDWRKTWAGEAFTKEQEAELHAAFSRLRGAIGPGVRSLDVALLPPLAEVRTLDLPPLSEREIERVLARDVLRHFPVPRAAYAVAATREHRPAGDARVLAAIASSDLLDVLHRAADANGFAIGAIVPAHGAWVASATHANPALLRGQHTLHVPIAGRITAILLKDGRIAGVRRFADASGGAGGGSSEHVFLLPDDPAVHAAAWVSRSAGPRFVPEAIRDRRRGIVVRSALRTAAAAAAIALLAAGVNELGARRELSHIQAARDALRSRVRESVAERNATLAIAAGATTLDSLTALPPRATALAMLAERIPAGAYLTSVRFEADSLTIEGKGSSASAVFEALSAAPEVVRVRTDAPVRQESGPGATLEHFTFTIRLARRAPDAAGTPDGVRLREAKQ